MENIIYLLIGGAIGYFWRRQEVIFKSRNENRILETKKFLSCYAACIRCRTLLSECLIETTELHLKDTLRASSACLLELQTQALITNLFFDDGGQRLLKEITTLTKQSIDSLGKFVLLSLKKAPIRDTDFETSWDVFDRLLPEKISELTSLIAKDF